MNKLAPDDRQFPEQGMTFVEFVQSVIPGLSEPDVDFILWELTPFPMASGVNDLRPFLEKIRDQLAAGVDLRRQADLVYAEITVNCLTDCFLTTVEVLHEASVRGETR